MDFVDNKLYVFISNNLAEFLMYNAIDERGQIVSSDILNSNKHYWYGKDDKRTY